MNRRVPVCLLRLLEAWLPKCYTCIKWSCKFSAFFRLGVGVRQGSSLAPVLFSVYVNDVIANDKVSSLGFLFAFADDILLISLSVCALQSMLSLVECELLRLDLRSNVDKCCCIRVGARFDRVCATLTTINNAPIMWCDRVRYLVFGSATPVSFLAIFPLLGAPSIRPLTQFLVKLVLQPPKRFCKVQMHSCITIRL